MLLVEAESYRAAGKHLLIDSHPVTKEAFGFRVTPFTLKRLLDLKIDHFICLYADPDVLAERIQKDPQGRPLPTKFELSVHVELQACVVSMYSILTGQPCHLVDSGIGAAQLMQRIQRIIGLI